MQAVSLRFNTFDIAKTFALCGNPGFISNICSKITNPILQEIYILNDSRRLTHDPYQATFSLLPTPSPVDVYFPSPYALPPIPLHTCSEPAKVVFSPNYGERDDKEKYHLVIKGENKNKR